MRAGFGRMQHIARHNAQHQCGGNGQQQAAMTATPT
jgi:hypothetical protein